jgi:hypothetical protein
LRETPSEGKKKSTEARSMKDDDFPYSVIEDEEVIAKFKRIEDASSFAANREWQDVHHTVSLVKDRATPFSGR